MNLEDDSNTLQHLYTHPSFTDKEILPPTLPGGSKSQLYVNPDAHSRKVHEQALTGMFGECVRKLCFFSFALPSDILCVYFFFYLITEKWRQTYFGKVGAI